MVVQTGDPSGGVTLLIRGMHCAGCVGAVEGALRRAPGVLAASVNLATQRAEVTLASHAATDPRPLIEAVRAAGYDAVAARDSQAALDDARRTRERALRHERQAIFMALMYGLPVIALHHVGPLLQSGLPGGSIWWWMLQALLTAMVLRTAAGPMLAGAMRSLAARQANMDVLVSLGALAAFGGGIAGIGLAASKPHAAHELAMLFEATVMVVLFVSVGKHLESRARGQASTFLETLFARLPREALRVADGAAARVPLDDLRVNDVVRIPAHETVPLDGVVESGRAALDESMLTGESLPVERGAGDKVFGGARVVDGLIDVRVTAAAAESTAARIARLVEQAQSVKPPWQRFADRAAGVFVPVVMVLALLTLGGWLIAGGGAVYAFERMLAVLVVACPCALGLAIPTAVLVGTTRAARQGILVRDAAALEAAGAVREVVLDKTGTLTLGRMSLSAIASFDGAAEDELLALAASLEQHSQHPLARAIVRAAEQRGVALREATALQSAPGSGVSGRVANHEVAVGRPAWVAARTSAAGAPDGVAEAARSSGATSVVVAIDGRLAGELTFTDQPRPEAAEAVAALRSLGVGVRILSGDSRPAVADAAARLGIQHYEAELTPDEKLDRIRAISAAGLRVAMVGDGVNDAPALAAADVGFAIGAGADVAREAAAVCLVGASPRLIPEAIRISRASARVMKQNLAWAVGYNLLMLPLAMLTPLPAQYASAAMMLSSFSVVANSLRLRKA